MTPTGSGRPPSRSVLSRLLANKYVRDARTFPAAARDGWRREGWAGVWRPLSERTLQRVYRRERLLVFEQDLDSVPDVPPPEGVEIRRLDEAELGALGDIASRARIDRMRRALDRGRIGLVAWRAGRAAGWAWVSDRLEPEIETHLLPLPPDAAYLWDLYVDPRERGAGVGTALAAARARTARARGFRRGWRAIARDNVPSLRTLARTSAGETRLVGELRYLKLLRRIRSRFVALPAGASALPAAALLEGRAR